MISSLNLYFNQLIMLFFLWKTQLIYLNTLQVLSLGYIYTRELIILRSTSTHSTVEEFNNFAHNFFIYLFDHVIIMLKINNLV
jgi:hypothetical protein